jgi:hypothetical protein
MMIGKLAKRFPISVLAVPLTSLTDVLRDRHILVFPFSFNGLPSGFSAKMEIAECIFRLSPLPG